MSLVNSNTMGISFLGFIVPVVLVAIAAGLIYYFCCKRKGRSLRDFTSNNSSQRTHSRPVDSQETAPGHMPGGPGYPPSGPGYPPSGPGYPSSPGGPGYPKLDTEVGRPVGWNVSPTVSGGAAPYPTASEYPTSATSPGSAWGTSNPSAPPPYP